MLKGLRLLSIARCARLHYFELLWINSTRSKSRTTANRNRLSRNWAMGERPKWVIFCCIKYSLCLNTMPLLVLSICLTCPFRVTVSALLSLVGPIHQLLLSLAAFKCYVCWTYKFDLIDVLTLQQNCSCGARIYERPICISCKFMTWLICLGLIQSVDW